MATANAPDILTRLLHGFQHPLEPLQIIVAIPELPQDLRRTIKTLPNGAQSPPHPRPWRARTVCLKCSWDGYVDTLEGEWRTTCPKGCRSDEGNAVSLRPILHIPFDPDLYHELNVERYELGKTGKILFNHPQGTHDDRFWSVTLARTHSYCHLKPNFL